MNALSIVRKSAYNTTVFPHELTANLSACVCLRAFVHLAVLVRKVVCSLICE